MDDPSEEDLDAQHAEELRLRPPVQLARVGVNETQNDERNADGEERLKRCDEEVRPVLQLVHRADAEEDPSNAERTHQFPTAV